MYSYQRIVRFSIGKKLILSYLTILIIPMFFISVFTYRKVDSMVIDYAGKAYGNTLQQIKINLDERLTSYVNLAQNISTNTPLRQILDMISVNYKDLDSNLDYYFQLNKILNNTMKDKYIRSIKLLIKDKPILVAGQHTFISLDLFKGNQFLNEFLLDNSSFQIIEAGTLGQEFWSDNLLLLLKISSNRTSQINGVLILEIDKSLLDSMLNIIELPDQSFASFYTENGELILGSHNELKLVDLKFLSNSAKNGSYHQIGNQTFLTFHESIALSNWYAVISVSKGTLRKDSSVFVRYIIYFTTIIILLIIPAIVILARHFSKRLHRMFIMTQEMIEGQFGIQVKVHHRDEITLLQSSFNEMSRKIKELLEQINLDNREKLDLERRVLLEQMNPHFIYNTLDLIKWLAVRAKESDIQNLVDNLTKMLRSQLCQGKEFISLKEDIENIHRYVEIVNYRYSGKLRVHVDLPESLANLQIPKMILQPIVENAIKHGIAMNEVSKGVICIDAHQDDQYISIHICDDGPGVPESEIENLFHNHRDSYGLFNIQQRLKMLYGESSGLEARNLPNGGFCMTIKLFTKLNGQ